ncbi:hypothetical protein KGP36_07415, partial [Patescibacteria group bacterium]|nr:hypothetical protein [Patescibacteria group bacterium]
MSASKKSLFFLLALLLTPFSLLLTSLLAPAPAHASTTGVSVYGPSTLYSGLVGWWTMDGKDTNWATGKMTDNSGNGSSATLYNVATSSVAAGIIGQGMHLP